jgi:hypothetical protein
LEKVSFAQIKLPFDAAPRLVLQFAAAKEVVDPLALGGEQRAFYFVMKLIMSSDGIIAITLVSDVFQQRPALSAVRLKQIRCEIAFRCKLGEPLDWACTASERALRSLARLILRSLRPAWERPSFRMTHGNMRPCPTRVIRITENSESGSSHDKEMAVRWRLQAEGRGLPRAKLCRGHR